MICKQSTFSVNLVPVIVFGNADRQTALTQQGKTPIVSAFLEGFISAIKLRDGMGAGTCTIKTGRAMELVDITSMIADQIAVTNINSGLCFLFNPHTTAGLTINEGADPDVQTDIIAGFQEMVPMSFPFKHLEGNSPAHIMASLMGSSLTITIENGRLQLGVWQKIFFCEFDGPRTRKVHWQLLETA